MSVLSTLAAQFAQHELTKYALNRKREVARKRERKKIDEIHSSRRVAKKKTALPTRSQKAAQRREGAMKNVAPYQSLMKALSPKKRK